VLFGCTDYEGSVVTHVTDSPKPPASRITLTLPTINDAFNVRPLRILTVPLIAYILVRS
jgi:6-phosphogluconolactonase/glucosamine-6-phosphate isomerase/deaminase